MDEKERNRVIQQLLNDGNSLSEVQRTLESEYGERLTYMELRLLASELEVDWDQQEPIPEPVPDTEEIVTPEEAGPGRTVVSISKIQRPGTVLSGDVTFASGAEAEWMVDQAGRLGLNPKPGSAQPTQDDIQDFQVELQRVVQQGGM